MLLNLSVNNYEEAERYLLEIPKFTSTNAMGVTKDFYEYLFSYALKECTFEEKIIHVAGTNGKGSVCAYLNAILVKSGMRVGMFTSPHLVTMRERFQINGEKIDEELFTEALLWVEGQLEEYQQSKKVSYKPTFFEMFFFMGVYIFTRESIDIILLETGLGGRLDATNVTTHPLLTIITEIGLDHMQYLGDTIEKIAAEKAGIIKQEVPVVFGTYCEEKKSVAEVIQKKADFVNASTYCLHRDDIKAVNIGEKSIDFLVKTRYYDYIRLTATTTALYQIENAALAVRATDALQDIWQKNGEDRIITREAIQEGICSMRWEARMEEIMPGVFIDGGHNQDGVKAFLETVVARQKFHQSEDKNILLFSAVNDKAYEEMIRMIAQSELFDTICVTGITGTRGTAIEELRDTFKRYTSRQVQVFEDVWQAWEECTAGKGDRDTVYVVGSLYLAGLIKEHL